MQVVVDTLDEKEAQKIQEELKGYCSELSFSPMRVQPNLMDCLEFYATARLDDSQKEKLLEDLDDDWDQEDNTYWAYGFNTKIFNKMVYYLKLDFD